MDDDLELLDGSALPSLLAALHADGDAVLAGGCYATPGAGASPDCFNLRFDPSEDGSVVRARRVPRWADGGCKRVHMTHNFFVERTAALRRFGWDPRQTVMEHETFFYQLYLNRQPVLACPSATVRHNVTHDQAYDATSFRKGEKNREQLQFWCKDFPEVRTLTTPYWTWRCAARRARSD